MERHSKHYEQMVIQPYAIMRQMKVLDGYLQGAAIKYIMRAGTKPDVAWDVDIKKAIAVLNDLIAEMEIPF